MAAVEALQLNNAAEDLPVHMAESQTEAINSEHRPSQTDVVARQDSKSQTPVINLQSSSMQTPVVKIQSSSMQTPVVNIQSSSMQTAPKDQKQTSMQTDKKALVTTEAQTDFNVRIVPPKADQICQAGSWNPQERVTQTDLSMLLMSEGVTQTEVDQDESSCQTDIKILDDRDTQTVLETTEISSQTVKSEQTGTTQTEVCEAEVQVQTDLSIANMVEGGCQAVVETDSTEVQAGVVCCIQEAQTDSSMAYMVDQELQVNPEMVECVAQTDIKEEEEKFVQTELATAQEGVQTEYMGQEQEVQTEYVVVEVDTQTDEQPDINEALPSSQVSSLDEIPSSAGEIDFKEQLIVTTPRECNEEGCQTDPVTIIIGDASFLVKKLKGASLSPTKISSMGNEIEIELRADDDEPTYDLPEKENVTTVPVAAPSRSNPQSYRARGPRTRGGGVQRGNYRSQPGNPGGPYYASSAGHLGKYSCPVCSDTFHESPALYEHLQTYHCEAFNLIKKPRGREGKTIICKPSPEPEPPVLTPVEPITASTTQHVAPQQVEIQLLATDHIAIAQPQDNIIVTQSAEIVPVAESVSMPPPTISVVAPPVPEPETVELFEEHETVWQSPNKARKRTLARRQITDEDAQAEVEGESIGEYQIIIQQSDAGESEEVVGGKRKRDQEQIIVKRIRSDEDVLVAEEEEELEEETVEEEEEEEELPTVVAETTPRRRGRPPKIIKLEKVSTPADEAEDSPRTRGRLRTPKK